MWVFCRVHRSPTPPVSPRRISSYQNHSDLFMGVEYIALPSRTMASPAFHKEIDEFMRQDPPRVLLAALTSFLSAPLPKVHSIAWIPPADEVAIRKELCSKLHQHLVKILPALAAGFNAVQVSTLFLMPLDNLRELVGIADLGLHSLAARLQMTGLLHGMESMQDLVRYCESCILLLPEQFSHPILSRSEANRMFLTSSTGTAPRCCQQKEEETRKRVRAC